MSKYPILSDKYVNQKKAAYMTGSIVLWITTMVLVVLAVLHLRNTIELAVLNAIAALVLTFRIETLKEHQAIYRCFMKTDGEKVQKG